MSLRTLREGRILSKRIADVAILGGAAFLVCVLGMGAFVLTEVSHKSPAWVFLSLISLGFVVGAREEYRKEFRSVRFIFFVCGWLVINMAVCVVVLNYFGWLYLIPALLFEQFLFYMTAYWFFGVEPPLSGSRPFLP